MTRSSRFSRPTAVARREETPSEAMTTGRAVVDELTGGAAAVVEPLGADPGDPARAVAQGAGDAGALQEQGALALGVPGQRLVELGIRVRTMP